LSAPVAVLCRASPPHFHFHFHQHHRDDMMTMAEGTHKPTQNSATTALHFHHCHTFIMTSTSHTSADDSRSSTNKEAEQKTLAAVQPQEEESNVVTAAVTTLLESQHPTTQPTVAAASSSNEGADAAAKRTIDDAGDASSAADAKSKRTRLLNDMDHEAKNDAKDDEVKNEGGEVLDFARTLGLVDGDRLQVKWEIVQNDGNGNDENAEAATVTHWWTATLLPHDGRVVDENVAIRTLDYDPYPDGGFPERSREDVVFLGPNLLVDPVTRDDLRFRRLGETHDIEDDDEEDETDLCMDGGREDLERIVNETLAAALAKQSAKWQALSVAQQSHIASVIAEKKEALLTLLEQHQGVITGPVMQQLLAQAMAMPSSSSTPSSSSHHY
jgi:hypothetical protein